MMKQHLLTMMTALMLSACMANAAWTRIDESDDTVVYADIDSLKRSANTATLWHLNDLKTARQTLITMSAGQSYLSTKVQQEFDCQEQKVRTLSFAAHSRKMGSGNVVLADDEATHWVSVFPGSIVPLLFEMACGKP